MTKETSTSANDAPEAPSSGRGRNVLFVVVLLWALVATGLALTVGGDGGRSEVRGAAITFVTTLTTWDATDGLDDTVDALRELGTGEFLTQIDDVLGDDARATAEAVGATSQGEVVEVLVSEVELDRAVALVIVTQTLTVGGESVEQEQIARIEFVLQDGRWLVERSELLNAPAPLGAVPEGEQ